MSYSLSFSDDFYSNDGDANGQLQLNAKGQPVTLHSAIRLLLARPSRERRRLCLWHRCSAADLTVEAVMDRARQIDTCASIASSGVPVYLTTVDRGYGVTVTVYDGEPVEGSKDPEPLQGYPARRHNPQPGESLYVLQDWRGNVICPLTRSKTYVRQTPMGRVAMACWRAEVNGLRYSGRNGERVLHQLGEPGLGTIVTLRPGKVVPAKAVARTPHALKRGETAKVLAEATLMVNRGASR